MYASISSVWLTTIITCCFFGYFKDLHVEILLILGATPYGREQSTSCSLYLSDFFAWTVGSCQELGMIVLVM